MKRGDLSIRPMLCLLMLCFYFHVFVPICCFCKLLGFVFMRICRFLWFVPCYAAFMFCCLILLVKYYAFSLSILTLVPL